MNLRVAAEQKAMLMRAAALTHADLTEFVTPRGLARGRSGDQGGGDSDGVSHRDFGRILALLDNPPKANARLRAAAAALPRDG